MNAIHFLIDTGCRNRQNHCTMPNRNNDMAAMIETICGDSAAPWRERIAALLPTGAPRTQGETDHFSNVRGFIIEETITRVLAGIAASCGRDGMKAAMSTYIKLQALESQTPGEAVDFLLKLQSLVREKTAGGDDALRIRAARAVENSIDEWITVAVEMYHESCELLPKLMHREKRRTEIRTLKKDPTPETHQ